MILSKYLEVNSLDLVRRLLTMVRVDSWRVWKAANRCICTLFMYSSLFMYMTSNNKSILQLPTANDHDCDVILKAA
jgi:hypothetical protein